MVRAMEPTHTPLIIHSDGIESKRYECLSDVARDNICPQEWEVRHCETQRRGEGVLCGVVVE